MRRPLDLAGKQFGALHVIERAGVDARGAILWKVHCDRCGQDSIKVGHRIPHLTDCGCRAREKRADLSGQTFGHLQVIARAGSSKSGDALYRCLCTLCGREALIPACSLRAGQKSCGCYINHEALRRAAVKGGARMAEDPAVRQKWQDTMKRTGKDIELAARLNRARLEKVHVNGTNPLLIRKQEPNRNNTSGYRGVYAVKRRGKVRYKGMAQIQGEIRYTREYHTPEEAKAARDELQLELIQKHGLRDLIFGDGD